MLKNTLLEISDNLKFDLYDRDPKLSYITVDRITAVVLLDLVDEAISREDQKDGA